MDSTLAEKVQEIEKPKPQLYSLKTPYMEQGRVQLLVAETPNLKIHMKINAEVGENAVHTHLNEDHSFIVLEGEMTIYDDKGNTWIVKPYQGILLPKGAYYRYHASGTGNMVMLRVSASVRDKPPADQAMRVRPDGKPLKGQSVENKNLPPIKMPGKFFAESAGLD